MWQLQMLTLKFRSTEDFPEGKVEITKSNGIKTPYAGLTIVGLYVGR
jgi:hypothetical protein